jgi:transposase
VDGKVAFTRRFVEAVGRDCEDAAVSRVASKWALSPSTARRIDKRYLEAWHRQRRTRGLRQIGVDEIFWKKGSCLTVVSDLERGEPIWAAPERKSATLDQFFTGRLTARQRRGIRAVCMDMWGPYLLSVRQHVPQAVIVFDKFHVMQHVGAAVDETRRQEFFRRGQQGRDLIRGKRWLMLTRWANLQAFQRRELETVFLLNRRLFKAHLLKEQIDHLWDFTYEGAAIAFFYRWVLSIRWQRLPAFQKLAGTLERHLDGIVAYCRHKVPFGLVEAINGNIRAAIRRGRGYRDHAYLILKVQKATAARRLRRRAA